MSFQTGDKIVFCGIRGIDHVLSVYAMPNSSESPVWFVFKGDTGEVADLAQGEHGALWLLVYWHRNGMHGWTLADAVREDNFVNRLRANLPSYKRRSTQT